MFKATRQADGTLGVPVLLSELSSPDLDQRSPVISADGLTIYFSRCDGTLEQCDIFVAHRSSVATGFGSPTLVAELNTTSKDRATWLSPDNCDIYLFSNRGVSQDIYIATRR